jgi:mannose-6-phosphate isomerase-like protein (cupin superfamily)
VTQLKDMEAPHEGAAAVVDTATVREAIERYLANPVFRAARYEELVVDDNPYRRPVRPDDIGMVDFSGPLDRDSFSRLSGLMGHRMLLNVHDSHKLILPTAVTDAKWRDFELFYSQANRVLGDLIRPYLEEHLYGFVVDEAQPRVTDDVATLRARLGELAQSRSSGVDNIRGLVAKSPSHEDMSAMVAIQAAATSLNARLQPPGALPVSLGLPADTLALESLGRGMAERAGVKYEAHSYFQYYLPSTLGLMNYVSGAAQDPSRVFRLVGAALLQQLDDDAMATVYETALPQTGSEVVTPRHDLLSQLQDVVDEAYRAGGPFAVREVSRGIEEYAILLEVHDEDFRRQFTWIDAMPGYVAKAERLQNAIDEYKIPVALDTFVESWEECSTTHVHDDDRLLVIESGEMEFWNCFGTTHKFQAGDKTFIPKNRLHGSVVLTGECVYHQPVITADLDARFG